MIGEFLSIIAAILWATGAVIAGKVLRYLDPIGTNTMRSLFSAILVLFIALIMGELQNISNIDLYAIFFVIIATIIGMGLGDTCLYKSIILIGVSRSYLIAYTFPFFTMLFGTTILKEPFLPKYLIGAAIIFLGIMNIVFVADRRNGIGNPSGVLIAFIAAILWSTGLILITIGIRHMGIVLANAIRFPFLFIFLFSISRLWESKPTLSKGNLALLAISGTIGMAGGSFAFLLGIKLIGISRAASLCASSPIWASILSSIFLMEKITWRVIASAIMVAVGVYFLT